MYWFPRLMPPTAVTSRSTSTHLLAASVPGNGPDSGGPAGRPSVRRSRARSTSDNRDGTVLIRHPPMLRCTVVASIQRVTFRPGAGRAEPELLRPDGHVPAGRNGPVDLDRIRPADSLGYYCRRVTWPRWRTGEGFQVRGRPQARTS